MRLQIITHNVGGLYTEEKLDPATYTGPSPMDERRVDKWCEKVLSCIDRPSPPELLVLNMQEVGGLHKENLALLMRQGDILPKALNMLTRRIRQLYSDAATPVWISKLVMQGYAAEGYVMHPASASGLSPGCAAASLQEGTWNEVQARSDDWQQFADPSLIPQGILSAYTALGSIFMVPLEALDTRRVCLVDIDSQALLDPRDELLSWTEELCCFVPSHRVCRHAKLHVSSRKGFLMTRWYAGQPDDARQPAAPPIAHASHTHQASAGGADGRRGGWFNLVNVHFIHDMNNEEAAASTPSSAAVLRGMMMGQTQKLLDINSSVPTVMAGDFNFRLDLEDVVLNSGGRVEIVHKNKVEHQVLPHACYADRPHKPKPGVACGKT